MAVLKLLAFFLLAIPCTLATVLRPRNGTASTAACNNSPDLCNKAYSSVTQLGAHDSPFLRDATTDYSESGNQDYNTTVQLESGVRLVTAQVYNNSGSWDLCHTSCALLDAGTLESWLSEIKSWMDANPNDVVTVLLVNSDDAAASDLDGPFQASGITQYAYTPPATTTALATWPTLQELIDNNTRLVTFVASLSPSSNMVAPYLLDEFTFVFENQFLVANPDNFSCVANRPASVDGNTQLALQENLLPLMNHFLDTVEALDIQVPDFDAIDTTNGESGIGNLATAADSCAVAYGKNPTFILVDFFDQGPAIDVVDKMNGVTDPVGRLNALTTATAAATSATSDAIIGKTFFSCWTGLSVIGVLFVFFA
ncbi:MAG: hypothetical protein MMC33_008649 [Icmadophila ericetorum]|nr:hypothetical protein [Icmadophila ericetorum]